MLLSLSKLPPKSVVILHPAAHNPTGADPTKEEWAAIADAMEKGGLFPFFLLLLIYRLPWGTIQWKFFVPEPGASHVKSFETCLNL